MTIILQMACCQRYWKPDSQILKSVNHARIDTYFGRTCRVYPLLRRHSLFRKNITMTALFIIAVLVFGYMCYVLLKPEKF